MAQVIQGKSSPLTPQERMKLYQQYGQRWSVWKDLRILYQAWIG
ncbi:MAG: sugar transferase [Bacteroidia bacterium]|nr:sugar transferase [Bacteroidia bacterium]